MDWSNTMYFVTIIVLTVIKGMFWVLQVKVSGKLWLHWHMIVTIKLLKQYSVNLNNMHKLGHIKSSFPQWGGGSGGRFKKKIFYRWLWMKQCSLYEWMVTTKSLEIMTIASQVENKLNKPVMSVVRKTTRTYSDREVWASLNKTQVELTRCLEGVQNVKSGLKKWNLTFSQHFSFTKK